MRAMPVVLVEPRSKLLAAFVGVLIGAGIGPLAQGGLDEPFRLAVGARGVGPGETVLQAPGAAGLSEGSRAISRAIVGENGPEADAEAGVIIQRSGQECQH